MVKTTPFDTLWGKHGTNIYWRMQSTPTGIVMERGYEGIIAPPGLFSYDVSSGLLLIIILIYSYMMFRSNLFVRGTINLLFKKQRERSSIFEPEITAPEIRFKLFIRLLGVVGLTVYAYTMLVRTVPLTGSVASFLFLVAIALFVILIICAKLMLFNVLAYVFGDRKMIKPFIDSYFTVLLGLGTVLLPLVALQTLAQATLEMWLRWICLIACLAAVLLILYKVIQIFWRGYYSLFYIILYLCTLEILPILVGIRVMQMIDIRI